MAESPTPHSSHSLAACYQLAATQQGLISTRQLSAVGISSSRVSRLVSLEQWRRLSHGVYEVIVFPNSYRRRVALAYLNATDVVTIIGCASLVFHDLIPEWRAEQSRVPIEIGTAGGVNAVARGLGQVCVSEFDVSRSVEIDGFRVCSVERALLDACRILPRSVARDVVSEALRREMTTQSAVLNTLRAGRRGGTLLRQLVNSFSAVNRDVFGRRFLELCEQAQVPVPTSEYVLDLSYGDASHIRLDFYWPTLKVAVELDGFAYHSTAADLRRDRQRQNVIVQAGITLLRYTWSDVTTDGTRTMKQLQTALSSMSPR